jgi:hypothetical protein
LSTTQSDDEQGEEAQWEGLRHTGLWESAAAVTVNDATDTCHFLLLHAHRIGHCLLLDLCFSLVLSLSLAPFSLLSLSLPSSSVFLFQLDLRISGSFCLFEYVERFDMEICENVGKEQRKRRNATAKGQRQHPSSLKRRAFCYTQKRALLERERRGPRDVE